MARRFSNDEDYQLRSELKLPESLEKAVFDISKTRFLMEEGFRNLIPAMLGLSEKELRTILKADQKIKTFGFIDEDGDLDSSLLDCIEEQSIDPYFTDLLKP